MKLMPQEIEVWYVIPALRRELARVFIEEHHLSQKEAAELLGVTESAISQYFSSKRATEFHSTPELKEKIKETAKKIIADKKNAMKYLYDLTMFLRDSKHIKSICDVHKKFDATVPKNCTVCCNE